MATKIRRAVEPARFEHAEFNRAAVTITRASLRELREQPGVATLVDLSTYGCRLATPRSHRGGARAWLRFDVGWPLAAQVVCGHDGQIGCRFEQPIGNLLIRKLARA